MKLLLATVLSFITGAGLAWLVTTNSGKRESGLKEPLAVEEGSKGVTLEVRPVPLPETPRLEPEESEIPEIIDALRGAFAGASELVGMELTSEVVRGLFGKPESQVRLLGAPEPEVEETKAQIKVLPRRVIYWRPGALSGENLDGFAAAWPGLVKEGPLGLVVDLRQVSASAGFEGAADLLSFFASPESTLFTIQELKTAQKIFRAGRQPLDLPQGFPVVVLVHGRTKGAAEVAAEWLAMRRGALLLGMPTAGQGWPYREVLLKSGRVLRLPVARVVSPTGQELAKGPVRPDVVVVADPVEEAAALAFASAGRVDESVAEVPVRKQQSEASLIREESPELDELIANQGKPKPVGPPPPKDVALQRAIDVIEAIAAMHGQERAGVPGRSDPQSSTRTTTP
ncbi:MAG: S41 family peptidase [Verrucomicrobiia bacterium]